MGRVTRLRAVGIEASPVRGGAIGSPSRRFLKKARVGDAALPASARPAGYQLDAELGRAGRALGAAGGRPGPSVSSRAGGWSVWSAGPQRRAGGDRQVGRSWGIMLGLSPPHAQPSERKTIRRHRYRDGRLPHYKGCAAIWFRSLLIRSSISSNWGSHFSASPFLPALPINTEFTREWATNSRSSNSCFVCAGTVELCPFRTKKPSTTLLATSRSFIGGLLARPRQRSRRPGPLGKVGTAGEHPATSG